VQEASEKKEKLQGKKEKPKIRKKLKAKITEYQPGRPGRRLERPRLTPPLGWHDGTRKTNSRRKGKKP